jgi:hypothetical protein
MLGGNNNETFAYGLIISAVVLTLMLPLAINLLYPANEINADYQATIDEMVNDCLSA